MNSHHEHTNLKGFFVPKNSVLNVDLKDFGLGIVTLNK